MNEKFFERKKYNVDCRRSYDNETQNQCEYIAKLIDSFNVVFVLQREFVEIMRECQITLQYY